MKQLKIFDAVEEVMRMDDLQLIQARKHFDWKYLRSALKELEEYVAAQDNKEKPPQCTCLAGTGNHASWCPVDKYYESLMKG